MGVTAPKHEGRTRVVITDHGKVLGLRDLLRPSGTPPDQHELGR